MDCYLISENGEFLLLKALDEYGEASYNLIQAGDEDKYENRQVVRAQNYNSRILQTMKEFTAGLLLCNTSGYREFSSAFILSFFPDGSGILLASMNRELMSLDISGKVVVFRKLGTFYSQIFVLNGVNNVKQLLKQLKKKIPVIEKEQEDNANEFLIAKKPRIYAKSRINTTSNLFKIKTLN